MNASDSPLSYGRFTGSPYKALFFVYHLPPLVFYAFPACRVTECVEW